VTGVYKSHDIPVVLILADKDELFTLLSQSFFITVTTLFSVVALFLIVLFINVNQ